MKLKQMQSFTGSTQIEVTGDGPAQVVEVPTDGTPVKVATKPDARGLATLGYSIELWDLYFCATVQIPNIRSVEEAAKFADDMVEERRKRQ